MTESQFSALQMVHDYANGGIRLNVRNPDVDALVMSRHLNRTRVQNCIGDWVYPLTLTDSGRKALEGTNGKI